MSYYFSKILLTPFDDALTRVKQALATRGFGVIGTMLPCNVIVREEAPGHVVVAAIDPVASMEAVDNKELHAVAGEVRAKLRETVDSL